MIEIDKNLDRYLAEIRSIKPLPKEKEMELFQKIKHGCRKSFDELIRANLKFVVKVANKYRNQGLSLNDLIGYGNTGLIKAVEDYDETRGLKFMSYAVWWIRQSILMAITQKSTTIRITLTIRQQVHELRSSILSIETPVCEEKLLIGTLKDEKTQAPDEIIDRESNKKEVNRLLNLVDENEREILKLYYGIDRGVQFTLDEIGMRSALTRERIRQIKKNAIRKIRRRSRSSKNQVLSNV